MTLQYSVAMRNAQQAAIEATIGASPTIEIRTGAAPANCAAADTGTVLATITCPADWLDAPANGAVNKLGVWQDNADADGVAGHFRIRAGAICHIQGSITQTGGGGDMTVVNTNFAEGQSFTVDNFTITRANG